MCIRYYTVSSTPLVNGISVAKGYTFIIFVTLGSTFTSSICVAKRVVSRPIAIMTKCIASEFIWVQTTLRYHVMAHYYFSYQVLITLLYFTISKDRYLLNSYLPIQFSLRRSRGWLRRWWIPIKTIWSFIYAWSL